MKVDKVKVQEQARRIMEEFARSLADSNEVDPEKEHIIDLRVPKEKPVEGFKERLMRNMPNQKDGEPRMERKGW